MDELIAWSALGLPVLLAVGMLGWFYVAIWTRPDRHMKRLEKLAAAGESSAQKAVERAGALKEAMTRAAGGGDAERQRVRLEGKPARAIVLDVRATGLDVSAGPVPARLVEVDLSIGEGAGGYTVTVCDAVSQLHQGRLLKGATVQVRVDPLDPQRVVVLWDMQ